MKTRLFSALLILPWIHSLAPAQTTYETALNAGLAGNESRYYSEAEAYFFTQTKFDPSSFNQTCANFQDFLNHKSLNKTDNSSLSTKVRITEGLMKAWLLNSRLRTKQSASALQTIISTVSTQLKTRKIDNYVWQHTSMNIYVPGEVTPGEDPEMITDPALKAKVLAAIEANAKANSDNALQTTIKSALPELDAYQAHIANLIQQEHLS